MNTRPIQCLALLAAALLAGCGKRPAENAGAGKDVHTYDVRGVVEKVDAARGVAVIAHEEIPDYMVAMTMEFEAADRSELREIQPGDAVTFRLRVTDRESRIEGIRKTGRAEVPVKPATMNAPAAGAQLPDVALVDDAGRAFRLADLKGRTWVVTFIFTRCPLPDFCPRMNANFAATRRIADAAGARFLSVTIDPSHDTPQVLAEYAKGYRADADGWQFATGDATEIRKLASFAGLEMTGSGAAISHNLRTMVIDREGRVARVFSGNDWQPEDLASAIKAAGR